MAERKWTAEQKNAIDAEGTLLVSAAAGSGKTAVLVERVIRKITDRNRPCDADRLLVVTYTNAAAAEMRERVANRLAELISQNPEDLYLQRQQILLQNAHISTIHSFCLDLIRENFEKLDIPADFRIADENEVNILRREVLEGLLEERYAADIRQSTLDNLDDKPFIMLTEMLGSGRDDAALVDTILRLYTFMCSLPDPKSWLDEKLSMVDTDIPVSESVWGAAAAGHVARVLRSCIITTEQSIAAAESDERMLKAYGDALQDDLASLKKALAATALPNLDWDVLRVACSFGFTKLGALRKFEDEALKERVSSARKSVKEALNDLLKGVLCCSSAEYEADIRVLRPVAACLFDTVWQLNERFFAEKLKRGILDFSDLEQLALKLLVMKTDQGFLPTLTAKRVAERYDEVLVDEYQDTNSAQDTIFKAISKEESNLFMVGDVKQSIYRFRQAMPEIFIAKKENFAPFGFGESPAKIILGRNFRSRSGVTSAVNFVFNLLMSKGLGEIDYGEEDELIPAAEYPERLNSVGKAEPDFELQIIDGAEYEGEEERTVLEARHIAGLIKGMIEGGVTVSDGGAQRRVTYRDFCILMRSVGSKAEKYMREFAANDIPVYADIAGGYLGSYEVAVILSLLRVVDNPLQDVPLLSVMFSPVFGFTADDLAKIRVENRKKSLYLALRSYAQTHTEESRFTQFLELLKKLRSLAAVLPADKLILRIYQNTSFDDICSAMPGGEKRRANLRLLLDYARNYESAGYKGLSGFIRLIDRLSEQSGDLAPAAGMAETADVVRIMTIHKSKGLEYPVCILADCAKPFNTEDIRKQAIFHPDFGFGSIIRNPKLNCYYTTLPKEVVKLKTLNATLSEELRVLYVAMTRAKERLIAVMSLPNLQTSLKKAASMLLQGRPAEGGGKLLDYSASQANSYADWLLCAALSHPTCGRLRSLASLYDEAVTEEENPWGLVITRAEEIADFQPRNEKDHMGSEPNSKMSEEVTMLKNLISERLRYRYPYQAMTAIPSKVAVSEFAEKTSDNFSAVEVRPAFLSNRKMLTGAQAGTALHAFMQYARLDLIETPEEAAREVERLVGEGYLLPEQGEAVEIGKVMTYLHSGLYRRVKNAQRCYKEFKFNLDVPAHELYNDLQAQPHGGATAESVMMQGMADVVFEEDDKIYILDYKTDHVSRETGADQLREHYAQQLHIYAEAVERILGKPVAGRYIYSLTLGEVIPV